MAKLMNLRSAKRAFKEQQQAMQDIAYEGEVFVHCIDDKSFAGKCYAHTKAISNLGRVWSLPDNKLYDENRTNRSRQENGYLKVSLTNFEIRHRERISRRNTLPSVYRHWLVANYFLPEQKALYEKLIELGFATIEDIQVHHKQLYAMNYLDEFVNRADNLQFMVKIDHEIITDFQTGKAPTESTIKKWSKKKQMRYRDMRQFVEENQIGIFARAISPEDSIGYVITSITQLDSGGYSIKKEFTVHHKIQ